MEHKSHWTLSTCTREMLPSVSAFIHSWNLDDVRNRFGIPGSLSQEWLIDQLSQNPDHRAFVAIRDGDSIGLLDYTTYRNEVHFGILVDKRFRRKTIGSNLVAAFLEAKGAQPARAQCRGDNHAAIRLLRSARFQRVSIACGELEWVFPGEAS